MSAADEARAVLSPVDAKAVDGFLALFGEDLYFRLGNLPVMKSRAALREMLEGFFPAVGGIRHTVEEAWRSGDALLFHGEVDYQRLDGSHLLVPYANILRFEGPAIRDYRSFVDNSALFSAQQ